MAKGRSTVQGCDPETQSASLFQEISAVAVGGERQRSSSSFCQSPPEAVATEASAEVVRLLGAIAELGESNPHSTPLKEALRVARAKSILPVNERIEACKSFIEKARKPLVRTEAVLEEIFESELRVCEARLAQLQSVSATQPEQPAGPSVVELSLSRSATR